MSHSRIALLIVPLVLLLANAANGQHSCAPVQIIATSNADTIFVQHVNAYTNCCIELVVELGVEEFDVNFYESDVGPPCNCLCCFNLRFDANGFAAGHYVVRVWDGSGTYLIGESEVDVDGPGGAPVLGVVNSGECRDPEPVLEPQEVSVTWGKVKTVYR